MGLFRRREQPPPLPLHPTPPIPRSLPPPSPVSSSPLNARTTPTGFAWQLEHVKFFRPLEFYRGKGEILGDAIDFAAMSDEEIAQSIFDHWGDLSNKKKGDTPGDQVALWSDSERIWSGDLECDALEGNEAYVEVMGEWAAISRGTIKVGVVSERWELAPEDEDAPEGYGITEYVTLELEINETHHLWKIPHSNDWLNFGVLAHVNRLIAPSGMQFYSWDTGDQTACAVVLSPSEAARIVGAREARLTIIDSDEY
jgi:hypothetical protein